LSLEFFIAKRILPNRSQGIKVSRPILRIAVISISLSIVVNLLTFAVVTGFQNEIRKKITGFSAPLFIQNANNADFYEADPIQNSPLVESILSKQTNVLGYNRVAYKPGMLQGNNASHDVLGILFKGIDQNYQRSFLKEHLKAGSIPTYDGTEASPDILLSDKICQQLGLKLNDEVSAFFVKNRPISRKLKLVGIYNTGFEEYDQQMAICDIRLAQQLNDWGISGQLEVGDSLVQGQLPVILTLQGKTENLSYDWGEGPSMYQGKLIPLNLKDTTLSVQLSKVNQDRLEYIDRFKIHIRYSKDSTVENPEFQKITTHISGKEYDFHCPINGHQLRIFKVSVISGNGTSNQFLSGYEIHLSDWYQLDKTLTELKQQIERIPNDRNEILKVVSIFDLEQDLFNWLAFLDINVVIIVSLMLLIGIINIGSALLVLIIIRSNFIGLMKAFGSSNGLLRKIFLVQAAYLIFRGLLFGNIIGLGIYLIQSNWGIITLNPDVYYLNKVPMELDFATVVLLNLGTFILCMISLLLPSSLIARVNPIKSIKFN